MNSTHTQKKNTSRKNGDKDGEALCKLINIAAYRKTMGKLRNRIDVKLVSNDKYYLKMDIKTKLYVTQNIWQWFSCDTQKQSYINA